MGGPVFVNQKWLGGGGGIFGGAKSGLVGPLFGMTV